MAQDEQAIRRLAYELWQSRGRPEGSAEADWFAAERRLSGQPAAKAVDESVKESFPASDPPAPPLPDNPPVNADEKWAAAEQAQAGERTEEGGATPERARRKRAAPAKDAQKEATPPRRS